MTDAERARFNVEWPHKLFEGGWICATWPAEYGGKGLTTMQGVVLAEEFAKAKAPMRGDFFGDTLVGPTFCSGAPRSRSASSCRGSSRGTTRWCQGFTEPDSGSDLASLKTRPCSTATSGSSTVRRSGPPRAITPTTASCSPAPIPTRPSTRASRTCWCPMRQPGVEVRGITQPDGTAEFCEVFFNDARCPKDNVVGGVNNGWKVANSTLASSAGRRRPPGTAGSRRSSG